MPDRTSTRTRPVCTVPGCGKPRKGRGMCGMHYQRMARTGTLGAPVNPVGCTVDGCTGRHKANGLCRRHYMQEWNAEQTRRAREDRRVQDAARMQAVCWAPGCDTRQCAVHPAPESGVWIPDREVPCSGRTGVWFDPSTAGRVAAIAGCSECPLVAACAGWAARCRPSDGVWGGKVWAAGAARRFPR